ncbi:MAG: helix-turn-helix domain-containing protein [Porticoccaceae bacterium]
MASPSDTHAALSLPGFRLRMARTERGMTLEEIAEGSGIPVRALAALEADDYARLPEAVYVRGYVRRYARLLGIAAQPLVDDFDAHYGMRRDENASFAGRKGRVSGRLSYPWLLGGGAAAGLVLILGAVLLLVFR